MVILDLVNMVRMLTKRLDKKTKEIREGPHGVMVKVLDCRITISEFKLQLHYYIHFRTNTLRKGMSYLSPLSHQDRTWLKVKWLKAN